MNLTRRQGHLEDDTTELDAVEAPNVVNDDDDEAEAGSTMRAGARLGLRVALGPRAALFAAALRCTALARFFASLRAARRVARTASFAACLA